MKFKIFASSLLLLLFSSYSMNAIGLNLIGLSNINGIDEIEEELLFIINEGQQLDSYIPDQYWDFPYSKEYYSEKLVKINDTIIKYEQTEHNQDYYLLLGLLNFYLYNLNYPDSFINADKYLRVIESFPNRDYRSKWFLGTMYAKAAKSFESIQEFEFIAERVPEESLHPLFWNDYAYSALMAFMPKRSMIYYELYSKYANISLENIKIYNSILESFTTKSVDEFIEKDDLFMIYKREEGYGFISYPLGIWVPVKDDWNIELLDYNNNFSAILCKSAKIKDSTDTEITYSIGSYFYIDQDIEISTELQKYKNHQKIEISGIDPKFEVYEIWDSEQYKHIGGAHGYIAFYRNAADINNLNFEQPSKISTKNNGAETYVPFRNKINKLTENITYMFLLDSCENIFEQSKIDFIDFLSNVIIE